MTDALIGHTGFVGGNLARQRPFDEFYNSKNIEDIRGRSFDTVICAGAPGSKWYANENPGEDRESVTRLTNAIRKIEVKRFVLISTVDVFSEPRGVNEDSLALARCPYGNNRLDLEVEVEEAFGDRATIIRLPALFGPGLKKNALYDLMTGHETEKIAPNAVYQWYPVEWLAADLRAVGDLPIVHLISDGLSMERVGRFFPGSRMGECRPDAPHYDVASKYPDFRIKASVILKEMEAFIAQGIQQPR